MGRYPERPGRCSAAPARTHWGCSPNPTLTVMRAHRGGMEVSRDSPGSERLREGKLSHESSSARH
jgi:hypothetical protein